MPVAKSHLVAKHALPFKTKNKLKRQQFHLKRKKATDSLKRDDSFRRKREEDRNPHLRQERLSRNAPATIDTKRRWDSTSGQDEDLLALSVDAERSKRRRLDKDDGEASFAGEAKEDDADSMLGEAEGADGEGSELPPALAANGQSTQDVDHGIPHALRTKFPSLFHPPPLPKVLVTTSINSTLHKEAALLATLFPNAEYVRRSTHRFAHRFSVREISKFATNRNFTTLLVLGEDQKRPSCLTMVHLPSGPSFTFSILSFLPGDRIPGHARDTRHYPELILNNFCTPLGLLTAQLFRTIFPRQPELQGRQVVTLHNQRDFIFLRRHRYVFRDKRKSEKSATGGDGKPVRGAEELKVGLQEIGPRLTLKLRRIDQGIQRASGQEWEWKAGMDKTRTRFNL